MFRDKASQRVTLSGWHYCFPDAVAARNIASGIPQMVRKFNSCHALLHGSLQTSSAYMHGGGLFYDGDKAQTQRSRMYV